MAQRIVNAERGLVANLAELGGISESDAQKVALLYRQHKVVKLDAVNGVYICKHGAFFDRENIRHVANKAG